MIHPKHQTALHFISCTAMLISLLGCERETYTSWNCQSAVETNISMVLRKAQLEFHGTAFNYCGSLGNQSYFDQNCINQIEKSRIIFHPKTGLLVEQDKEYQCIAL